MSDKLYIAVGTETAGYIESLDARYPSADIFQETELTDKFQRKKPLNVYLIDTKAKDFEKFKTDFLKAYENYRKKSATSPTEAAMMNILHHLEKPNVFQVSLPAGPEMTKWLQGVFGDIAKVEEGKYPGTKLNRVTIRFERDKIGGDEFSILRNFYEQISGAIKDNQDLINRYGTKYLNLYLFAKQVTAEEEEPAAAAPKPTGKVPITIDQTFKFDVLRSKIPVLVDFWADWCDPCKEMAPIVEELNKEYEGRIKVYKLDIDENPETVAIYGNVPPRFVLFNNGHAVDVYSGATSKENLKSIIDVELSIPADIPKSRDDFESKYDELGKQYRKKALALKEDTEKHLSEDGELKVEMNADEIESKLRWLTRTRQDLTNLRDQYCLLGYQARTAPKGSFDTRKWYFYFNPYYWFVSNDAENRDIFIKSCEIARKSISAHTKAIDSYGEKLIAKLETLAPPPEEPAAPVTDKPDAKHPDELKEPFDQEVKSDTRHPELKEPFTAKAKRTSDTAAAGKPGGADKPKPPPGPAPVPPPPDDAQPIVPPPPAPESEPEPALIPASKYPNINKVTYPHATYSEATLTFTGTIKGYMVVPNMKEAIKLFTGENASLFKQLPGIEYTRYNKGSGILIYVVDGGTFSRRDLGYSVKSTPTTKADGTVVVSWKNAGTQPKTDPRDSDDELIYFASNNGSWTLKPIKGYSPPIYEVTWNVTSVTKESSLHWEGGIIARNAGGTVKKNTKKNTLAIFKKAQKFVKAMKP